jgi:hypothetical protein
MGAEVTKPLSIVTVIVAMAFNFPQFLMGSPATVKNIIVTLVYITIGILVLIISARNKNRQIIKASLVFWLLTFIFALFTAYINLTDAIAYWAIPFVIVLLGPWYGISFFTSSFLMVSIIIVLLSLGLSIAAVLSLRRTKHG